MCKQRNLKKYFQEIRKFISYINVKCIWICSEEKYLITRSYVTNKVIFIL